MTLILTEKKEAEMFNASLTKSLPLCMMGIMTGNLLMTVVPDGNSNKL